MHSVLKQEMKKSYVSQKQIACLLKITEQQVGNKIRGRCSFTVKEVFRIHEVFFPEFDLRHLFALDGGAKWPQSNDYMTRHGEGFTTNGLITRDTVFQARYTQPVTVTPPLGDYEPEENDGGGFYFAKNKNDTSAT